jgi:tetratricopeptide (TPR) repeat protein
MIRLAKTVLLAIPLGGLLLAQTPSRPAETPADSDNKAGVYYNFAMGRLYAGLAASEGSRNEYVNKAIQHYQEALKLDPSSSVVFEELVDLYLRAGRMRDAVSQAEDMLKQNPENLHARRMLGRIYVRAAGDPQTGRVDEVNLRRAIEQFDTITQKDPKDVESWVMLGRLYRVATKSSEAEKAFNAALQANPENEDAITQLAILYAELGDSKRAIEKLKTAVNKTPNERLLALLAEQYEQMQDYKSAADVLRKALELAPDNDRLERALATNLMYAEQFDDALRIFQKLLAEEPRDISVALSISKIHLARHDYAKAREALDKARAIDAQNLEARYQEVKLFEAEGRNDQAMTALKSMLEETARRYYSPVESRRRAGLLEEYGILSRNAEKTQQAIETFREMATLGGEAAPRAAVQIIDTYRQVRDYANAMKEAEAGLKKFPDERMIRVEYATVLADQGKVDAAAAEIRGLLKGDRERDRETYLNLAQIFEKAKRYTDMGQALNEAEKLSTSNDDKETVFFMRGAMYERMKEYDASEAEFRKALELDPNNAGALNYLGYMLADRNVRLDEAYELIKKALDIDPNNGAYLDSMGWLYYRQGKLDEAEALLLRALDRITKDPTIHDHLGDVYMKQGKTREAIAQWQLSLNAFKEASPGDADPVEVAKVSKKLDDARIRLAQETKKN